MGKYLDLAKAALEQRAEHTAKGRISQPATGEPSSVTSIGAGSLLDYDKNDKNDQIGNSVVSVVSVVPQGTTRNGDKARDNWEKGENSLAQLIVDWKEGVARLRSMRHPATILPDDWGRIIATADRLMDQWSEQLAAMGWPTIEVFGCHPRAPCQRYDAMGLVMVLAIGGGRLRLADVRNHQVVFERESGVTTRCQRGQLAPETVLLWEMGTAEGQHQ